MPRESIGECGCAEYPDRKWIVAELELAICFLRHACGDPPAGYQLDILWHEHDLGEYASVGLSWDTPSDAPWDYIVRAEEALQRFDQAVSWSDLESDLSEHEIENKEHPNADDAEDDEQEPDEAKNGLSASDEQAEQLEVYRRDEMVEIGLREWQVALRILKEQGWHPVRPFEMYTRPLWLVTHDEAKEMQRAAESLFAKIKGEPALSASVPMNLGLLYQLMDFIGRGAFIVGKPGAFADAQLNDFPDVNSHPD